MPGSNFGQLANRDRLCEAIGIKPEVYIDTLAWAMKNPSTPELVSPAESPVFDHMQEESVAFDCNSLPLATDRGRYMSASVIIAEINGQRNRRFHRQFLRDKNHLVVRLVLVICEPWSIKHENVVKKSTSLS